MTESQFKFLSHIWKIGKSAICKGDDVHTTKISAKYGCLKPINSEDISKFGSFHLFIYAQLTKCVGYVTREKLIQWKVWFSALVGVYGGFNMELSLERPEKHAFPNQTLMR